MQVSKRQNYNLLVPFVKKSPWKFLNRSNLCEEILKCLTGQEGTRVSKMPAQSLNIVLGRGRVTGTGSVEAGWQGGSHSLSLWFRWAGLKCPPSQAPAFQGGRGVCRPSLKEETQSEYCKRLCRENTHFCYGPTHPHPFFFFIVICIYLWTLFLPGTPYGQAGGLCGLCRMPVTVIVTVKERLPASSTHVNSLQQAHSETEGDDWLRGAKGGRLGNDC